MSVRPTPPNSAGGTEEARDIPREVQQKILRAVAGIRFGSVEVVIQDGKVVQIESREKQRIRSDAGASA